MKQWSSFLLGKPERTLKILGVLTVLYLVIYPDMLGLVLARLISEVEPFLGSFLLLGLLFYAFRRLIGK